MRRGSIEDRHGESRRIYWLRYQTNAYAQRDWELTRGRRTGSASVSSGLHRRKPTNQAQDYRIRVRQIALI